MFVGASDLDLNFGFSFRVNRGSGSTATKDYLTLGQHDKSLTNQLNPIRFDIFEICDVKPLWSEFRNPTSNPSQGNRAEPKSASRWPSWRDSKIGEFFANAATHTRLFAIQCEFSTRPKSPRQRDYWRLRVSKDWRREVTLGECQRSLRRG